MNGYIATFLLINTAALLLLPRRWAPLPLIMGACYIAREQIVQLGPLHFSFVRILLAVGIFRIIVRSERFSGRMIGMDKLILGWSLWMLISSVFHHNPLSAFVYRLGLIYDACGVYFLVRCSCRSIDDVKNLCRVTAILLVPVALEMTYEKITLHNLFYAWGGNTIPLYIREGNVRAQGAFAHAILAGTIGAVCLPLMLPLWRRHRAAAAMGIGACLAIIFASASSGPIVSMVAALMATALWHVRDRIRLIGWTALGGYFILDWVMKDPAYFLMARIDLVGGSTGWHRAKLIQSSFEHLPEWWLGGTDYTRHWMESGLSSTDQNTDITNHYLQLGVVGGLPLILLFMAILAIGFSYVGRTLRQIPKLDPETQFVLWGLGASLFTQGISFLSVSYFDQSVLFIYLTLAAISAIHREKPRTTERALSRGAA